MFALARLLVIGLFVLTIVYICLSLYSRAVRRGKLIATHLCAMGLSAMMVLCGAS